MGRRKIASWVMAFVLSVLLCVPVQMQAAETIENPFLVRVTGLETGGDTFVAELQLKKPIVMSAFDVSVCYDNAVLDVNDKSGVGYAYTDEFKKMFSGGQMTCNDMKNEKVKFVGVCAGAKEYSGTIAKIYFSIAKTDAGQLRSSSTVLNLNAAFIGIESKNDIEKQTIQNPLLKYELTFGDEENPGNVMEVSGVVGDVNENGQVQLNDAQSILKTALLLQKLTGRAAILADVDGDGKITLSDAQLALRKALLLIP